MHNVCYVNKFVFEWASGMHLIVYTSHLRPNIDEVLAKQGNEGMSTIVTQLQMWWVGPGGPRLCYLFQ